jgi:hypothetical protein
MEMQPGDRSRRPAGKSFWQRFEEAGYGEKIDLACRMLAEESFLNETTLRDLLLKLYEQGIEEDARSRFDEVAECLRRHHPHVYEELAGMLLDWRLSNALADGRLADVAELGHELAALAAEHPVLLHENLDRLAYHGRLELVVEMMKRAWPAVQQVGSAVPGSLEGFSARATEAIIYRYLEENGTANAEDPALLAELETFFAIDPKRLDQFMALLTGDIRAEWRPEHFDLPPGQEIPAGTVQNLHILALTFTGYLHREEGVGYGKADLPRLHLPRYLLDRHSGVLDPREPLGDLMRQGTPPPLSRLQPRVVEHVLCPAQETLKRYLERLLAAANPQPYRAAALFECMPAWLRYLEANELIDAGQRERSLGEVAALRDDVMAIWSNYIVDPALLKAVGEYAG